MTDVGSADPRRRKPRDRPLVIVVTGHGKGKSTSSFGMLMRAWARGYRCGVFEESADLAREGWAEVRRAIEQERYEFLLLDELTYPVKWGWIDTAEVVETLRARTGFQHVVITGRDAAPELLEAADLVSEVVKVKHPMDAGIRAQQGIEW
jgi:cob(I)alamin adenosyltransferase